MTGFLLSSDLTWDVVLFRILYSMVAGAIIGVERERSSNPAGFRTHIIISCAASALMMLSIYLPRMSGSDGGDSGRIAAQVVSGIGFLGAGAIMRFGSNVQGLTTAATIWAVAALGLLIGGGFYWGALLLIAAMIFTLVVLDKLERKTFRKYALKVLRLWINMNEIKIRDIIKCLGDMDVIVKSIDFAQEKNNDITHLKFYLRMPSNLNLEEMMKNLSGLGTIKKIKMDQNS